MLYKTVYLLILFATKLIHMLRRSNWFRIKLPSFWVEHFFPLGGAGFASIFCFLLNSETLGACSFCSKLTIGRDSLSLEVVEVLQADWWSRVALPPELLLLTIFYAHVAIHNHKIMSLSHVTPKILFQKISLIFPKKFHNAHVPIWMWYHSYMCQSTVLCDMNMP